MYVVGGFAVTAARGKHRVREPCQVGSRSLPPYRGQTSRWARRASYDRELYPLCGGKSREPIRCAPRDTCFATVTDQVCAARFVFATVTESAGRREIRV